MGNNMLLQLELNVAAIVSEGKISSQIFFVIIRQLLSPSGMI
jgi:hypothetical protein